MVGKQETHNEIGVFPVVVSFPTKGQPEGGHPLTIRELLCCEPFR